LPPWSAAAPHEALCTKLSNGGRRAPFVSPCTCTSTSACAPRCRTPALASDFLEPRRRGWADVMRPLPSLETQPMHARSQVRNPRFAPCHPTTMLNFTRTRSVGDRMPPHSQAASSEFTRTRSVGDRMPPHSSIWQVPLVDIIKGVQDAGCADSPKRERILQPHGLTAATLGLQQRRREAEGCPRSLNQIAR
jgi:hypothetical protein